MYFFGIESNLQEYDSVKENYSTAFHHKISSVACSITTVFTEFGHDSDNWETAQRHTNAHTEARSKSLTSLLFFPNPSHTFPNPKPFVTKVQIHILYNTLKKEQKGKFFLGQRNWDTDAQTLKKSLLTMYVCYTKTDITNQATALLTISSNTCCSKSIHKNSKY